MVELNVKLPNGFVATGEFRPVKCGEYYLLGKEVVLWTNKDDTSSYFIILKKIAPQGEALMDCLCGVSSKSFIHAMKNARDLNELAVVTGYKDGKYSTCAGNIYRYAYPVMESEIDNFMNFELYI